MKHLMTQKLPYFNIKTKKAERRKREERRYIQGPPFKGGYYCYMEEITWVVGVYRINFGAKKPGEFKLEFKLKSGPNNLTLKMASIANNVLNGATISFCTSNDPNYPPESVIDGYVSIY